MFQRRSLLLVVLSMIYGSAVGQEMDGNEFFARFSQAMKDDQYVVQKDLVTQHKALVHPVFRGYEVAWCRRLAAGDAENLQAAEHIFSVLDNLASVNMTENRDRYLQKRIGWLRALTEEQRAAKLEVDAISHEARPLFDAAKKQRSETETRAAIPAYERLADAAARASDAFWVIQAQWSLAELYRQLPDYFASVYCYKKAMRAAEEPSQAEIVGPYNLDGELKKAAESGRIRSDLVDIELPLTESKTKHDEALAADMAKTGGTGIATLPANAPPLPTKHTEAIAWEDGELSPKSLPNGLGLLTPNVADSCHWFFWSGVTVDEGQDVELGFLPGVVKLANEGGKLFVKRPGKSKEVKDRLKAGAKPELHEFPSVQYLDGSQSDVAHIMMLQPREYTFNGFKLGASGKAQTIRFRGGSAVVGKIRGHEVTVFDSNGNGTFNTDQDFGTDTLVLGKGKSRVALPLTSMVTLEDKMYELKFASANGTKVVSKPYDGPTTLLQVKWVGKMKPAFLIARQAGTNIFLDLMNATEHPIWVVPGNYVLIRGYFIDGAGDRAKTLFIEGGSGTMNLAEGQLNTWEVGGAGEGFYYEVVAKKVTEKGQDFVEVRGEDVVVRGNFGERYFYSMFGAPRPKVFLRKAGGGPVWGNGIEMKSPERADLSSTVLAMFWPKDLRVKLGMPGDFEVKLEGGFDILGKIASKDWVAGSQ